MTQFVVEGPDAMAHFRMCQIIAALGIELRTGMSHSHGSIMNLARQEYGFTKRTKRGVLGDLLALYAATYGREYGDGYLNHLVSRVSVS